MTATKKTFSDLYVVLFTCLLCMVSALILGIAATTLKKPQTYAKELDRSRQMLIAAKLLNHKGVFQISTEEGWKNARFDHKQNILVPCKEGEKVLAKDEEIKLLAKQRIRPLLTDDEGKVYTLEEKGIDLASFLEKNKKTGYSNLPYKLFYAILENLADAEKIASFDLVQHQLKYLSALVIPVSGFGLWAPIYGYIALTPDSKTVLGTAWYEHGETPGLGANITEEWWQKQFYGKDIFQESLRSKGKSASAEIGIIVVKGKVKDVFGTTSKAKSAVDGISGATLTGDGVTAAFRACLTPYKEFFLRLRKQGEKNGR